MHVRFYLFYYREHFYAFAYPISMAHLLINLLLNYRRNYYVFFMKSTVFSVEFVRIATIYRRETWHCGV